MTKKNDFNVISCLHPVIVLLKKRNPIFSFMRIPYLCVTNIKNNNNKKMKNYNLLLKLYNFDDTILLVMKFFLGFFFFLLYPLLFCCCCCCLPNLINHFFVKHRKIVKLQEHRKKSWRIVSFFTCSWKKNIYFFFVIFCSFSVSSHLYVSYQ